MSRRATRSSAASRSSGVCLAIPDSLPENGTIEAGSVKRFKRELEDGAYAKLRRIRGGASIMVSELRDEWQRLLLPSRGSVHVEGS